VSSADSPPSVRATLEELKAYQDKQSGEIARLGKISTLLSVGLAVVLFGFILLFLRTLSDNFSKERIVESVQKHVPEMLPDVANGAVQIVTRVYPTYSELLQKEAVDAIPELSKVVEAQVGLLIEGIQKGSEARLHKAILDAFTGEGTPLRQAFPKASPQDVTKAVDAFGKDVEEDLMAVTNTIMVEHIGEIISLQKTLSAFDTKGLPDDDIALSKRLVHDLLTLVDLEVKEAK